MRGAPLRCSLPQYRSLQVRTPPNPLLSRLSSQRECITLKSYLPPKINKRILNILYYYIFYITIYIIYYFMLLIFDRSLFRVYAGVTTFQNVFLVKIVIFKLFNNLFHRLIPKKKHILTYI